MLPPQVNRYRSQTPHTGRAPGLSFSPPAKPQGELLYDSSGTQSGASWEVWVGFLAPPIMNLTAAAAQHLEPPQSDKVTRAYFGNRASGTRNVAQQVASQLPLLSPRSLLCFHLPNPIVSFLYW